MSKPTDCLARPHRHPAQPDRLRHDRPKVRATLGGSLRNSGQPAARPFRLMEAGPVGDRRRCLHVLAEGRGSLLLPSRLLHLSASPRGTSAIGDDYPGRPQLAGGMATRPQQGAPRAPSPTTDQLHSECKIDPPQLETGMLQNLRVVLQAIGCPQGYTESVVRQGLKKSFSSM